MNNLLKYMNQEKLDKIKNMNDSYLKAGVLVSILFIDKYDKNNEPYINHLLRVSKNMTTLDGAVAALLHDVVEDIEDITFDDLKYLGFKDKIIDILKLVTKEKSDYELNREQKLVKYNCEIANIINSRNMEAIELKFRDMSDNFNSDRLSNLDDDTKEWLTRKYGTNIKKLEKAFKGIEE